MITVTETLCDGTRATAEWSCDRKALLDFCHCVISMIRSVEVAEGLHAVQVTYTEDGALYPGLIESRECQHKEKNHAR